MGRVESEIIGNIVIAFLILFAVVLVAVPVSAEDSDGASSSGTSNTDTGTDTSEGDVTPSDTSNTDDADVDAAILEITATNGTGANWNIVDYSAKWSNNKNITGSGWDWKYEWTIGETTVSATDLSEKTYTYNGADEEVTITIGLTATAGTYSKDAKEKIKLTLKNTTPAVAPTATPTATQIPEPVKNASISITQAAFADSNDWTKCYNLLYGASLTDPNGFTDWTYSWNFGDGVTNTDATSTTGTYTYANPVHDRTYTVTVTAKSTKYGTTPVTNTTTVTLKEPDFDISGCNMSAALEKNSYKLTYSTTAKSVTGCNSLLWDFGDPGYTGSTVTDTSSSASGTYTYTGYASSYTVTLTAKSKGGQTSALTKTVSPSGVIAYFEADVYTGAPPLTVKFTDKSKEDKEDISMWKWDFDDGIEKTLYESEGDNGDIEHTFTKEGNYDVTLTTEDDDGARSKYTAKIVVDDGTYPTAAFSADKTSGDLPLTVKFTDASKPSENSKAAITSWYWTFLDSDGTRVSVLDSKDKSIKYSEEQNPKITFEEAGTYTVVLKVTDNKSVQSTCTKKDYINVISDLSVNIKASPTSGAAPLTVTFFNVDESGTITSYKWDFGDGSMAYGEDPTHTYTTAGTYTVKLDVTSSNGKYTCTKTNLVTVTGSAATAASTIAPKAIETTEKLNTVVAVSGTKMFGIGGTEGIRAEITKYYNVFDEMFSVFFKIFGMG